MSGNNNISVNAAYVASWKEKNPLLFELKTDGKYLTYQNQTIDISTIYIQDLLFNSNLLNSIPFIEGKELFDVIKLHTEAIKIKEMELEEKTRRLQAYGLYTK